MRLLKTIKATPLILFFAFCVVFAGGSITGEVSVDKTEVGMGEDFEIEVEGEDENDAQIDYICYKEEDEEDWTCYDDCDSSECSYSFERSEDSSGEKRYHGRVVNVEGDIGLTEFSESVTVFEPTGEISLDEMEVGTGDSFNIDVHGEDLIDISHVCYREEDEEDWTCYDDCDSSECSYSFERSEDSPDTYNYYGVIVNEEGFSGFTDPESAQIDVVSEPSVETFSVVDRAEESVTLKGYVSGFGGSDSVEAGFQYKEKEEGEYTKESETVLVHDEQEYFEISLEGLVPGEVYSFRAFASNVAGREYGMEMLTTELIKNGYFQTGNIDGWDHTERGNHKVVEEEGNYYGEFGFKDEKGSGASKFYQVVSIPENASDIRFSAEYKYYTYDYDEYDEFRIRVNDEDFDVLEVIERLRCPSTIPRAWSSCFQRETRVDFGPETVSADLSDYAGETVILSLGNWRDDDKRRSWGKITDVTMTYTPALSPSVETEPVDYTDTGSALLGGDLTDMGQSDVVDTWFVWDDTSHGNINMYENRTEESSVSEKGVFNDLLGNLESDTTYYFRAVAETNGGLDFGNEKTFETTYSASGGWRLPDYHNDVSNMWRDEQDAYDWDTATRAGNSGGAGGTGPRGYLEFHLNQPLLSNKIRVSGTGEGSPSGSLAEIDIRYAGDTQWTRIFENERLPRNHQYVEVSFDEDPVEAARFRFDYEVSGWNSTIGEFQFYEVPDEPITPPTAETLEAERVEEEYATVKGRVLDDGRDPVDARFKYWNKDNPEDVMYTEWDEGITGDVVGWATGEVFGQRITGLEEGEEYSFRAQLRNSATEDGDPVEGGEKSFVARIADRGWVSPAESCGTWDQEYEYYAYDTIEDTLAAVTRQYGSPQWGPRIEFTREPIFSDKIRFRLPDATYQGSPIITSAEVRINVEGNIYTVFSGSGFNRGDWTEVDISSYTFSGNNPLRVKGADMRLEMYSNGYFPYELDEFDFHKLSDFPEVETVHGSSELKDDGEIEVDFAGELICRGGADEVDVWMEWRKEGESYATGGSTERKTLSEADEFFETVKGEFETDTTYYYRAVAENETGISYGDDDDYFLTDGCTPGDTYDCVSYPDDWESGPKCTYAITCSEDGEWADRCEVRECATDFDCMSCEEYLEEQEGLEIEGDPVCTDECYCDYSNCEYVSDIEIGDLEEEMNYCARTEGSGTVGEWEVGGETVHDLSMQLRFSFDYEEGTGDPDRFYIEIEDEDGNVFSDDRGIFTEGTQTYHLTPGNLDWPDGSNRIEGGKEYTWRVRVDDSEWEESSFVVDSTPWPFAYFSRDPEGDIFTEEEVYFESHSEVYEGSSSLFWTFSGGDPSTSDEDDVVVSFDDPVEAEVELEVEDGLGRSCDVSEMISVDHAPPHWKEIPLR